MISIQVSLPVHRLPCAAKGLNSPDNVAFHWGIAGRAIGVNEGKAHCVVEGFPGPEVADRELAIAFNGSRGGNGRRSGEEESVDGVLHCESVELRNSRLVE